MSYVTGRICDAVSAAAKTGTPQLKITVCLPDTTYVDVFITLTEKTLGTVDHPGWARRLLSSVGFDGDFSAPHRSLSGQVVELQESRQTFHGRERTRWTIRNSRDNEKPEVETLQILWGEKSENKEKKKRDDCPF